MDKKNTHGGARVRAGRRTEHPDGAVMARHNVSLDERTLALLKVVGEGNVRRGIRHAAEVAYRLYQDAP
jgi:hypothetical protein